MAMITPRAKLSDLVGKLAPFSIEIVGRGVGVLPITADGDARNELGRTVEAADNSDDVAVGPMVGRVATVTVARTLSTGNAVGRAFGEGTMVGTGVGVSDA